jgi:hypothetical protein
MKQIITYILAWTAMVLLCISLGLFIIDSYKGSHDLKVFNKYNNTSYTLDEWQLYKHSIMMTHPFSPMEEK